MRAEQPGFVVVEGPIGVGKTSLAERLAVRFGTELLLEGPEENPFLERFYQDPKGAALPTQLFFLFQRARQLEELRQADLFSPVRVADFHFAKDRLFAEINLGSDKLGRTYADRNAKLCTIITRIAEGLSEFSDKSDRLGDAYEYAGELVVRNMLAEDAAEGIGALHRRSDTREPRT